MTLKDIIGEREKKFNEMFVRDDGLMDKYLYTEEGKPEFTTVVIRQFHRQSAIALLEGVVESVSFLEKFIPRRYGIVEDGTPEDTAYNQALSDVQSLLDSEIKSLLDNK